MTGPEWMSHAACVALPGLPWSTDTDDLDRVPDVVVDTMLATCAGCPVRAECDRYADDTAVTGGWWAGLDRDPDVLWSRVAWVPVQGAGGRLLGEQGTLPLAQDRGAA